MAKYGSRREGTPQPYEAQPTGVLFYTSIQGGQGEVIWVVRGGEYKGFGRIPRFSGNRQECEAVAQALNNLPRG